MSTLQSTSTGDELIVCPDCGSDFVWTAGQQAYFAERQLSKPKRCKPCRDERNFQRGDVLDRQLPKY